MKVIVPRYFFHDSSNGQNWETYSTSDPSVVHTSNPKSNGQSQNIETSTDPAHNDDSRQISEPSTGTETACEPKSKPPSR